MLMLLLMNNDFHFPESHHVFQIFKFNSLVIKKMNKPPLSPRAERSRLLGRLHHIRIVKPDLIGWAVKHLDLQVMPVGQLTELVERLESRLETCKFTELLLHWNEISQAQMDSIAVVACSERRLD